MAGSTWTTEFFSCPNCGLGYSATRERLSARQSGRFACEICAVEVHAWSGNYDFFDWKIDQPKSPVFGKRWENASASETSQSRTPPPDDDAALANNGLRRHSAA